MPPAALSTSHLPPLPARIAVVLGFLFGTWLLLDSVHRLITGYFLQWGSLAPTITAAGHLGFRASSLTLPVLLLGALWMLVPNLYLFQNRRPAWIGMLTLAVASLWYLGWATLLPGAIGGLLLLSPVRAGLNPRRRRI
jgi:hypothetical protein